MFRISCHFHFLPQGRAAPLLYWKTRPLVEEPASGCLPDAGWPCLRRGNIDGKLYSALSPAPVGTGGQLLRGDFNEDFQKIDAGLAGRGDCSLLFGSYVGTGTCGPSEPTALTLGIPAKALWVSCGSRHAVFLRGNTQAVNFSTSDGELLEVEWTQDGLSWKLGEDFTITTTSSSMKREPPIITRRYTKKQGGPGKYPGPPCSLGLG